jgi:hypothetical protein
MTMLNLIVDQYLSFAELQARQRRPMYMKDWESKLDAFLRLNERDILGHAGKIAARLGEEIAHAEFEKYWAKQRIDTALVEPVPKLENAVRDVRTKRKPGKE